MSALSASLRPARGTAIAIAFLAVSGCASVPDPEPSTVGDPDDQVEIGYGSQDRSEVTGAVSSVSEKDVKGHQVTRLEDLIEGRFPGVYVQRLSNGGISLRIRGTSSLVADGEPLYVIDGLPINPPAGSALLAVNAADIARIDILKDAGSTAIYGSRGANGVVLITTKRGQ